MGADIVSLRGDEPFAPSRGPDEAIVNILRGLLEAAEAGQINSVAFTWFKFADGTDEPLIGTFYRRAPGESIFRLLGAAHDLAHRIQRSIKQIEPDDKRGDLA